MLRVRSNSISRVPYINGCCDSCDQWEILPLWLVHYSDVIMGAMASQITSLRCLLDRLFRRRSKKHPSSVSLVFVREIHRWPVNSSHKWPSASVFVYWVPWAMFFHTAWETMIKSYNNHIHNHITPAPESTVDYTWKGLSNTEKVMVSLRHRDMPSPELTMII